MHSSYAAGFYGIPFARLCISAEGKRHQKYLIKHGLRSDGWASICNIAAMAY
jgi:hypothetical protein